MHRLQPLMPFNTKTSGARAVIRAVNAPVNVAVNATVIARNRVKTGAAMAHAVTATPAPQSTGRQRPPQLEQKPHRPPRQTAPRRVPSATAVRVPVATPRATAVQRSPIVRMQTATVRTVSAANAIVRAAQAQAQGQAQAPPGRDRVRVTVIAKKAAATITAASPRSSRPLRPSGRLA